MGEQVKLLEIVIRWRGVWGWETGIKKEDKRLKQRKTKNQLKFPFLLKLMCFPAPLFPCILNTKINPNVHKSDWIEL